MRPTPYWSNLQSHFGLDSLRSYRSRVHLNGIRFHGRNQVPIYLCQQKPTGWGREVGLGRRAGIGAPMWEGTGRRAREGSAEEPRGDVRAGLRAGRRASLAGSQGRRVADLLCWVRGRRAAGAPVSTTLDSILRFSWPPRLLNTVLSSSSHPPSHPSPPRPLLVLLWIRKARRGSNSHGHTVRGRSGRLRFRDYLAAMRI